MEVWYCDIFKDPKTGETTKNKITPKNTFTYNEFIELKTIKMGEILPNGEIQGYSGYCSKCKTQIKTNIQGDEMGQHDCGVNVLSLFDGMSCGRIALERAEINVNKYFSSEIKDYAIEVANHNYPQDKDNRLGDICKINSSNLPTIYLLIGGSPCQDFSGANKERLGVDGIKSRLFLEYVRLLKEVNPTYFLLENVRMKKEHQDYVSSIMNCEPIVINSSLVAPHLRHRLYWTNIPFSQLPFDKKLKLNDHLCNGYSDRDKARTLLESDSRPLSTPIKMVHRYFNTGFTTLIFKSQEHFFELKKHFDLHFKGKSANQIDELILTGIDLSIYDGVRYMNNRERESCQTITPGYTDILDQNDAACILGDGWTVDVIAHILKGII